MYDLDNIDRRIMNLLIQDGRMSASEIARRLKGSVSERSIRYRIERMIDAGVMRIGAIPSPKLLGYTVFADVWLEVDAANVQEVARTIASHPNVSYVATSIGERDISAQIIGASNEEVYNIVTEKFGRLPGVRKTNTSIVPLILKQAYDWQIPISTEEGVP